MTGISCLKQYMYIHYLGEVHDYKQFITNCFLGLKVIHEMIDLELEL